jgi:hypothetical protein
MQEMNYRELEDRASESGALDSIRRLETRVRVEAMVEQMKAEGKAMVFSEEEERMLKEFRRFKLRMRKNGQIFTWQTRMPEGVQLVEDTAEIIHPSEAVR